MLNFQGSNTNALANQDLVARRSRWGSLIANLEDDWDDDGDDDDNNNCDKKTAPGLSSSREGLETGIEEAACNAAAGTPWDAFGTAARVTPRLSLNETDGELTALLRSTDQISLSEWIASHRGCKDGRTGRQKYLEKCVHVLHSLASKIASSNKSNKGGVGDYADRWQEEIVVHPNFITIENVVVVEKRATMLTEDEGALSTDFLQSGDSIFFKEGGDDETKKKYSAMDALGRMTYEMVMLGEGPSISKVSPTKLSNPTTEASVANAMSISDQNATRKEPGDGEDEIINMLRKNKRLITSEDSSSLISAMIDAGVPFPLCRFVSDLLDNEDGTLFRSEHSFSSFKDVASDLQQMIDDPVGFLHDSSPDRWKLSFGTKLYGRDEDTEAFRDAANRVSAITDDPTFSSLAKLPGKRREVVMVSGHSGAGKSRLVRAGGSFLEGKGWRFLRCKFDRVVHPEPLSILASAFDEYFGSFASCPEHGRKDDSDQMFNSFDLECQCPKGSEDIRKRLEQIISHEGLRILSKHIPSLRFILGSIQPPSSATEVNEAMMASLFGKLLRVLSSERTPMLFFIDDLQWADPLSLSLLTALINGAGPDSLHLSSSCHKIQNDTSENVDLGDEEIHTLFAGSYRDNEVNDNHPLTRVLGKLESDKSVNVTNIVLSRFTIKTLNEMLSDSLCVPARRVRSLSELVMQKTDGQPLHVIEFIQALTMDSLLTHSFTRGWEWDADSIDICPITDSVAELFSYKLQRLPNDILRGLQIVSCFGSQIDQKILGHVADYDEEDSVDIPAAIQVALNEGLVEQAAQILSFSHDMIQKATIDSIPQDDLILLLRKLASAIIKNASASDELESVLFVVVDLINRIGSDATPDPIERKLFACLNNRAATKAVAVPDFDGGAKYSENGIAFLSDNHWETQYDLSLSLYETAFLSHFSSHLGGNRDTLMKRINAVFEHAKDFSDQFKTHCVWIKVLAMKDYHRAIEESLNALVRLGEPLDLANVDFKRVCDELVRCKEKFSGENTKFLSTNYMTDSNKTRAMKVMASMMLYNHQVNPSLGAFISCHMLEVSMNYGNCEESALAAAFFSAALVNIVDDIDEGIHWGRTALSLMERYDVSSLVPSIHAIVYGIVFVRREPMQSTLEPLARGIRSSFATGNVEFAMTNSIFYCARSFASGKNIRVLTGEVVALAHQHGNHFGHDESSDTPVYNSHVQYFLTPLYNTLCELEGSQAKEGEPSFPLDKVKFVNNDDIMKAALESKYLTAYRTVLVYQTSKAFYLRDMDAALKYADMFYEHFQTKNLSTSFAAIYVVLHEALASFYFARETGEKSYQARGEKALMKMKAWSVHSDWNFKNKVLLIEAEMHYASGEFDQAATKYEDSIKAAQEHKFIQEQAVASELAGIFFSDRGLSEKSHSHFKNASACYEEWGSSISARRVRDSMRGEFGEEIPESGMTLDLPHPTVTSTTKKKRQLAEENV